jgi:hypothetical protein
MALNPRSWMYQLVAEVESCDAEIYLNDMPFARLLEFENAAVALPVHPSIVDGNNEIKIVVNPGPVPASAQQVSSGSPLKPAARARARIVQVPLGSPPDLQAAGLINLEFAVAGGPSVDGPVVTAVSERLHETFGLRPWQRAQVLPELNAPLVADALSFIKTVATALQKGDAQVLAHLFRAKISAAAESYGLDGETQVQTFISQWVGAAASPKWRLADITPELASLRLVGANRVIDCVGKDWKPLLRMADLSAGGFLLGMGVGLVDGQWSVVS